MSSVLKALKKLDESPSGSRQVNSQQLRIKKTVMKRVKIPWLINRFLVGLILSIVCCAIVWLIFF